jgi:transposase
MNGIPEATPIRLMEEERAELLSLARSTKTEYRMRQRARIVLLAAEGMASRAIGREVGCTTGTASKWRGRYARDRLAGLDETGDRGAEPKYTVETDKRILAILDRPVPAGHGRWSGPLIAAELGDVDVQYVWRFLRAQKIDLTARKSWCESNDPAFAAKAAEIVGLYLDPPDGALVLAVDEKPSIQALERAQGYLKLPNGRALTGQSHDYKRHGTTTLFAALNVASGEIHAKQEPLPRRSVSQAEPSFYERSPEESPEGSQGPCPNALGRGSRIGGTKWLNSTARSLSSRAGSTSVVAWAIRPETKPIFIDARRAAGGSIAATLAKCSTMRGRHRIRPKIGANKI